MSEISLQDALNHFMKNSKHKSGLQSVKIEDIWEKLMGNTIAKYTDKIQIRGNTLFISTAVAPLKNELLYQKDLIISRVNEAMGEKLVKQIVIQ